MTEPSVSLVIPSYRGAARLPVLFEALRNQDFAGDWEAVVVIDGVVDDSEAVIDGTTGLPLRKVVLPENQGRPSALNAGFDAARGEVLVRCDDDLEPAPDFVRQHHTAHEGGDPRGVLGLVHNVFADADYGRSYGADYDQRFRDDAYAMLPSERWRLWAANCSVPRRLYDQVGHYDPAFRTYGWEDIDWGYRLAQTGAEIVVVPELEVVHHAANSSAEVRVRRAFHAGRSRARFDGKHGLTWPTPEGGTRAVHAVWDASIRGIARLEREARFVAMARQLDRVLGKLPVRARIKAIALLVESASLAGYRAGPGDDSRSV